ncbi:hypothetical protein GF351_00085 [Candidatus Woesearchaeota archaeon]|nr:hypothetical protein [Candidatus Woesearchaeota archaeon]
MLDIFIVPLCVLALAVGSYSDIRIREVPDWLSFGLIYAGLGLRAVYSAVMWQWEPLAFGMAGFFAFLAIAYLMFYTGQWGGGDSKLLMGLGAMIGIDFLDLSGFPFLLVLLMNILIIGAAYGICWSIFLAVKHRKKFARRYRKLISSPSAQASKRIILLASAVILTGVFFFHDIVIRMLLVTLVAILVLTVYLWVFAKAVEQSCMIRPIDPEKLTEGDWIEKEVKVDGNHIAGPKDLGVDRKQIRKLVRLKRQGRIKKIIIKEGIPFLPSFLIAYLVTLIFGNFVF